MRHCYKALFDVYEEIEELAIQRETKIFGVDYAKTSVSTFNIELGFLVCVER